MLQYFARLKRSKPTPMSDEPSTPGPNQPLTNEQMQAAAAAAAAASTPTTTTSLPATSVDNEQDSLFVEAYDCAKNNHNWQKVSAAISNRPGWLTLIPQGRRWTMLHQIVYSGNVAHLNEVLTYQISNPDFRFLCKALDDKTVREVASERAHLHPQMLRRVERLVATDQLLNNAKDSRWELVRQFLRQQPDIVNEKPPYRKYYLAHFLASTGQLDIFKDLSNICAFRLDLIVDEKTISQIARENDHIEFAEHVENLQVNTAVTTDDNNNDNNQQDEEITPTSGMTSQYTTSQPFFSQGFYDDPGIMIFSVNASTLGTMFLPNNEPVGFASHHPPYPQQPPYPQHPPHPQPPQSPQPSQPPQHHHAVNDGLYATHSLMQNNNPLTTTMSTVNAHSEEEKKSKSNGPPPMSDEEQAEYEKTIMNNIKKFSADNLLNAVTCCITKAILRDPVVAADGFTYEREAISSWFEHSNRSPMTNQVLENLELKPNHAIKSILKSLTEPSTDDKSKINGDTEK